MEKISNYLFEISWEVCNKVGGIYTVISSKAKLVSEKFENYYTIGPYLNKNNPLFLKDTETPDKFYSQTQELEKIGIKLHFGKWLIEGTPNTILVEHLGFAKNINEIKGKLWDKYQIDSLHSEWYDFDEAILWSWTCGIAIDYLTKNIDEKILVHAHEWMAGGVNFYLKSIENKNKFKTIFTTHATTLGRSLCYNGSNFYDEQNEINPYEKAYQLGVATKHQTELALAKYSDKFTTVSNITADESMKFFNKKCDEILYNGFLNLKDFEKQKFDFEKSRKITDEFLKAYFNDYYDINLDETYLTFTSGRNEFRNKGIDMFIDSLSKLNNKLKEETTTKTLVAFVLIMEGEFKLDKNIKKSFDNYDNKIKRELDIDFAPLSTHEMGTNNEIISKLIDAGLYNGKNDNVKVIFIPEMLDGRDKVFNLRYYDFTKGFDFSVFASYYEPWGYTPLESIAFSVPTITTNFAGFGRYVKEIDTKNNNGVIVLDRENLSYSKNVDILTQNMFEFMSKSQKEQILMKESVFNFSKNFTWNKFLENYFKVYKNLLEQ